MDAVAGASGGRAVDWIGGDVEVTMSPADLNTHGTPKSAIAGDLRPLIEIPGRGIVLIDRSRVVSPAADLSAEPDVLVVLHETVESGRVRLVRRQDAKEGRYAEIEGAPDLVVEVVSDSSTAKDFGRLRERYGLAGIPEYWIVDARRDSPALTLLRRGAAAYEEAARDARAYAASGLLRCSVRLARMHVRGDIVSYRLETRSDDARPSR